MIKQVSVILVLSIFIMACNDIDRPQKPDNLISEDQMSNLLYDLYIINAAKGVNRNTLEINGLNPEHYILEKYNIDSTQFAQNNTYYTFKAETYSDIIERVKTRLEKEKQKFEALKEKENDSIKKRRDSLKNLNKKSKDDIKVKRSLDSIAIKMREPILLLETKDTLQK
ncbi:DUF4296 domain-containing protein [Winogradskyella bathintestinalis]|uniref:DUF4296 domain-containing protein n=1 Tax=Winogradskyella bathintestinalis TaxID=3035208 RepID=A0ABT7ZQS7_9FLAO|nr:DUF4296 domain-containing protein [Winogradskyella bathintestinalis]MDN3491358.1 DUF4296 domain-containing protein [Winogradskyella bathintestinalis]